MLFQHGADLPPLADFSIHLQQRHHLLFCLTLSCLVGIFLSRFGKVTSARCNSAASPELPSSTAAPSAPAVLSSTILISRYNSLRDTSHFDGGPLPESSASTGVTERYNNTSFCR